MTATGSASAVETLRDRARAAIAAGLADRTDGFSESEQRSIAQRCAAQAADEYAAEMLAHPGSPGLLGDADEQRVLAEVVDEVCGLAGLQPLLADEDIETININGADTVIVRYADGRREAKPPVASSDDDLVSLIRSLAARCGTEERRFDRGSPSVNVELPDGSRLFACLAVSRRPSVSIRRHRHTTITLAELRRLGTLDAGLESLLGALVAARYNVAVVGGTGIGKTTLLRGLVSAIPTHERLVTIEDARELNLDRDPTRTDVVALQAREPNVEGRGEISQAELVRWALRMSPERVIVGEVRGAEVIPMCNAMSIGNSGSLTTVHAASSRGAINKLRTYAAQSPERLSWDAMTLLIAESLHVIVHLTEARDTGTRVVSSVREIVGGNDDEVISNEIYRPDSTRRAVPGAPIRTDTLDQLTDAGFDPGLLDRPDGWWQR